MQRWWWHECMPDRNFGKGALKGTRTAQPFIDNNPQRILVTIGASSRLNLLRCHIGDSARQFLYALSTVKVCTLGHQGNAKIAEQYFVIATEQHILRLD